MGSRCGPFDPYNIAGIAVSPAAGILVLLGDHVSTQWR